jgi:hypothetical protein
MMAKVIGRARNESIGYKFRETSEMNFNNTKTFQGALFLAILLLSACGGGGGSGAGNNTAASSAVRTAASDALFTDAASPVNITVVTDATKAVTQTVGSTGGTLSTTGADGSQFSLSIPANALTQDTAITMTPIVSASGVPLTNGLVAGVQFEPDGLFLEKDATLTIVPAVSVPVGNQTFLGYSGTGSDLHLVPPASPTNAIQMLIGHFSGNLLGNGIASDRAALFLKRAADHEARLDQELARVQGEERQKQLTGTSDGTAVPSEVSSYFASYYGLVIRNFVVAAGASCANATLAMQKYFGFERKLQLMGLTNIYDTNNADIQQILKAYDATCNALANRYTGTFTANQTIAGMTLASSGTVTFLRDDAACISAGVYSANTACYRVESVSFTSTTPTIPGCTVTPANYSVSLTNTPVTDSYLSLDLASMSDPTTGMLTGIRQYVLNAFWSPAQYSYTVTYTCPPASSFTGQVTPWAALASDPVKPTTPDSQQVAGSYSYSTTGGGSVSYTWSLGAAQ